MKVFISQPMKDKSKEEILAERERAIANVQYEYPNEKIEVLDSYFTDEPPKDNNRALYCLGKSFELLSYADVAYFVQGWNWYRGCKMEHMAALNYGIKVLEE